MDAQEFRKLPVQEQVSVILSNGKELLERIFVYYTVKLYLLDGLFVEIWYHQVTNRIDKVLVVEFEDVIHLYESQINISDLFK